MAAELLGEGGKWDGTQTELLNVLMTQESAEVQGALSLLKLCLEEKQHAKLHMLQSHQCKL